MTGLLTVARQKQGIFAGALTTNPFVVKFLVMEEKRRARAKAVQVGLTSCTNHTHVPIGKGVLACGALMALPPLLKTVATAPLILTLGTPKSEDSSKEPDSTRYRICG